MNKITGFSVLTTGEGERVTLSYSVLDADGNIVSTNNRKNYVVLDEDVLTAIATIRTDAARIWRAEMKSIDKRVHDLRRDVEGTFNRYGFSLAVDELVLENILQAVRAQMQQDADEEPKKQDATAQANLAIARMTQARSKGDQTESAPTDDVTRKR